MADKAMDNNQVTIVGTVDSEFTYSHEVFGEGFYMLEVVVNRLSHMEDRIPLMVSERLVDVKESYRGKIVEVHGQFRSYNKHEESRNRLILSVFVREFAFVGEEGTLTKPNREPTMPQGPNALVPETVHTSSSSLRRLPSFFGIYLPSRIMERSHAARQ